MNELYDKNGYPIRPGDVLKVFHFVAALRREKIYMYKLVYEKFQINNKSYYRINHLTNSGHYDILINDQIMNDYEIVQGVYDFRSRKKKLCKRG